MLAEFYFSAALSSGSHSRIPKGVALWCQLQFSLQCDDLSDHPSTVKAGSCDSSFNFCYNVHVKFIQDDYTTYRTCV